MPLFSILTPVFNSRNFLARTVQTVIDQGVDDLELILVDDCSTDDSLDLCEVLSRQYPFIKVVSNPENRGVAASRNVAIRAAKGDYIVFLDSDDHLGEGSLRGVAQVIEEKGHPDLIIGRYLSERYALRGDRTWPQDFTFDNSAIDESNPDGAVAHIRSFTRLAGVCWRYAIRREFLSENSLFFIDARIYEDQEFVVRLLCLARRFAFYDDCLYVYRARAGSLTQSITDSENFYNSAACLNVASELCRFVRNSDLSPRKTEFVVARIENSLTIFSGHLPMFGDEEVRRFSRMIDPSGAGFEILQSGGMDLIALIRERGAHAGLLAAKESIIEKTKSIVRGKEDKVLYVFCADLFGKVTAYILKGAGCFIECFLDNNAGRENELILNLPVCSPAVFKNKSKKELSDVFVVVCHQRMDVFVSISSQLESAGLKKEQIAHLRH